MKRRWPLYLAVTVGGATLAVAWLAPSPQSGLPPEIARELTPRNFMPRAGFTGSPPSGTLWESYVVPLSFDWVTERMKADPQWEGRKSSLITGVPRLSYRSAEAGPQVQVDVMPGRLFVFDPTKKNLDGSERPEEYSVVMVATPMHPPLRKRISGWIDRLRGHKPPSLPAGALVAYQYPERYRAEVRRLSDAKPSSRPSTRSAGTP